LVSMLPKIDPAPQSGDRAFVSDARVCAFGAAISGGGSAKCPVYFDGEWKAG
jgi:hypothetical protein